MKISKRMYAPAIAAAAILTGPSCSTDWGQTDPPAGVQTAPKLENVATLEFDEMLFRLHANADIKPALAVDEPKGNVLELNDGWVEMNNPLCSVTCEKAVSLTFWMKQMPAATKQPKRRISLLRCSRSPMPTTLSISLSRPTAG